MQTLPLEHVLSANRALLLLLVLFTAAAPCGGAEPGPYSRAQLRDWERVLERAERALADGAALDREQLAQQHQRLEPVRDAARVARAAAQVQAQQQRELLDAIGAPPAEGEPAESRDVAARRTSLNAAIGAAESQAKAAELVVKSAEVLLARVAELERRERTSTLLVRGPSPLVPGMWYAAAVQFFEGARTLRRPGDGGAVRWPVLIVVPAVALLVAVAIGAGRLSRFLLRRYGRDPAIAEPGYPRRVLAASVSALSRGLVPSLVFSTLVVAAWNYYLQDVVGAEAGQPTGLIRAILVLLLGIAFVRAAFSPAEPRWRVVPVSSAAARRMGRRLYALVAVIAADIALEFFLERIGAVGPELASAYSFTANLVICMLLLSLVPRRLWQAPAGAEGDGGSAWFWPALRLLVVCVALAVPAANLAGYRTLADFLLQSTLSTVVALALLTAVHVVLREAVTGLLGPRSALSRRWLALPAQTAARLEFWFALALDALMLFTGLVVVAALWGVPLRDMREWAVGLTRGVPIGSYTFAPADLLLALAAFVVVIAVTRTVQRVFERRVFPQTRLDIGVRTAVIAGLGYVGLVIAVLYAISVLGIDLTKLAIIAGALSVGIGFGLQNIVNNFVSGLILLVERPIKIGDWIVVGSIEGWVRRINVRATQIETFNRADVIIPNSELLQSAVVNLTHKSKLGRLDVPVGVAYAADIDAVESILLECAAGHPNVQGYPPPYVLFMNFGDSALEFELRVFLDDVETRLSTASDLRKAITRRFRESGVEIPFPQRDIWFRNARPAAGADGA